MPYYYAVIPRGHMHIAKTEEPTPEPGGMPNNR